MNTRQKGKLLVKKARLLLERQGFLVEVARPRMCFVGPGKVFSKEEDFWGKWDIVAVFNAPNDVATDNIKFVQVGVWSAAAEKVKDVTDFPNIGSQEIWLWVSQGKNSHFKILKRENEYKWLGDCYKQ